MTGPRITPRALAVVALIVVAPALSTDVPDHPRSLRFANSEVRLPAPAEYRIDLGSGSPAFAVIDDLVPLVEITFAFDSGSEADPHEKTGLAFLTSAMLERGGTSTKSPAEVSQAFASLGAQLRAFARPRRTVVRLSAPGWSLPEAVDLFLELMTAPGFDAQALEVLSASVAESLARRNDDPLDILEREWTWLLFGRDHATGRAPTPTTLARIGRDDLFRFHECQLRPERMVTAASGDLSSALLSRLKGQISAWKAGSSREADCAPGSPRGSAGPAPPGSYVAPSSSPQAKVLLGHALATRPAWASREHFALQVALEILGGSGAISRLNGKLRTAEALAYRASAALDATAGPLPDTIRIFLETRPDRTWRAVDLAIAEIERLRRDPVHPRELEVVRATLLGALRSEFDTAEEIAGYFADDALRGRPASYWSQYLEAVRSIESDEILAAARKHLDPERLTVLVVGPQAQLLNPAARKQARSKVSGDVERLPERDPATLEPEKEQPVEAGSSTR